MDFVWVRLKPHVPRGVDPWPLPGQQLTVICNVNEDFHLLPPLYRCEWDVAGKKRDLMSQCLLALIH